MTMHFTAVVDHGLLRPTVPIELQEGSTVEVFVVTQPSNRPDGDPAAILADLAKLSSSSGDPRTGLDHDKVIYGAELGK